MGKRDKVKGVWMDEAIRFNEQGFRAGMLLRVARYNVDTGEMAVVGYEASQKMKDMYDAHREKTKPVFGLMEI